MGSHITNYLRKRTLLFGTFVSALLTVKSQAFSEGRNFDPHQLKPASISFTLHEATYIQEESEVVEYQIRGNNNFALNGEGPPSAVLSFEFPEDSGTILASSRYGQKFEAIIEFFPKSTLSQIRSPRGMQGYESTLLTAAKRDKSIEVEILNESSDEDRYSLPRNSRTYTLPNGNVLVEDLGLRYRPFGTSNAKKIAYALRSSGSSIQEREESIYLEEYLIDLRDNWSARVRLMSEEEKSLHHYSGVLLTWLSSLKQP